MRHQVGARATAVRRNSPILPDATGSKPFEACVTIACETFLAGETGTVVVFVVRLCCGRPNQLDWCAQLRSAQQSAQNGEER